MSELPKWDTTNGSLHGDKPVVFDDIICRDDVVALFKHKLADLRDASHEQWVDRGTMCLTVPGNTGTGKTMMMSALATEALKYGIPTWDARGISSKVDVRSYGEKLPTDSPSIVVFEETNPESNTKEWKAALGYILQSIDMAMSKSPAMRVLLIVVLTCDAAKAGALMN